MVILDRHGWYAFLNTTETLTQFMCIRIVQHGDAGRGKADGRVPDSILRELPGTLGSVLETSSHSSGHFNTMLEHSYNRERERMGLRPPKSPAYDSDSDQPSSDDELAGEDITLSATKMASDNR